MNGKHAVQVLHVVGGMNYGGVETWLMHILRQIDREQFQMDFLVHTTEPCAYDAEIRALGARILPCPMPNRPWRYARDFARIVREYGPYDVVHSHVHHYSGLVLWLARRLGVPIRIAHSHNDTSREPQHASRPRRLYLQFMEAQIARHATAGLAVSDQAAAALFSEQWASDPRYRVLSLGLDFTRFGEPVDRAALRRELGIPAEALVLGHVGRFAEQKNHALLVQVAAETLRREPRTHLLLVGTGPLRPLIEQQVAQAGLAGHVTFAGVRDDVPRLMRGAMDVFVLPSLFEGLGLVLVEAQAAGLPCVISDVIPVEADVAEPLVRRLALTQPAATWAAAVLAAHRTPLGITPAEARRRVEASSFNIVQGVEALKHVYALR